MLYKTTSIVNNGVVQNTLGSHVLQIWVSDDPTISHSHASIQAAHTFSWVE